jgi:hypothetical protein
MEVNVQKCSTASYLLNEDRLRYSLASNLKFLNHDIPNLTLNQSLKYLGTAVAARRNVKLKATNAIFDEMKTLVRKIIGSQLSTVQKIDAVKTFVIPHFDFLMLNGEISKVQLNTLDSFIRGELNKMLKLPGLPVECHHMSWRDGGFSIPSLSDRRNVLSICSLSHMILSTDTNIQAMTRAFIDSEREFRRIPIDTESTTKFMNWKDIKGSRGTASLINKSRKAAQQLDVHFIIEDGRLTIRKSELVIKPKSSSNIGRFLTQKIIRPVLAQQMMNHQLKGASFHTLENNHCSNKFLRNNFSRRSDAFFRFAVAARADSLPTPSNIQKWYHLPEEHCHRCNSDLKPTRAHILNKCEPNFRYMTDRHNRLVRCVRKAIEKHIIDDVRGAINENTSISIDNLSEATRNQRPDIWFIRRDRNQDILEILEFCSPFGRLQDEQCTLKRTFDFKADKYRSLAEEVTAKTRMMSRVHPIIVSSLGAVYKESMTCLKTILKCSDKDLAKLGTWLSDQAIMGSFRLWIEYQKTNEHHNAEAVELVTEIDIANQENIPDIEDDENNEEEEDRNEETENFTSEITSPRIAVQVALRETNEQLSEPETSTTNTL